MKFRKTRARQLAGYAAAAISGVAMLCIMASTLLEAVGRHIGHPLLGQQDFVAFLQAFAVWLAISYTEILGGHITTGFFLERFPASVIRGIELLISVLILVVCALALRPGIEQVVFAFNNDMRYELLRWPLWISYLAAPAGFFFFGLLQVIRIRDLLTHRPEAVLHTH